MGVPIQVITPVNHKFELQLENLKPILEADAVKDRNVIVVSVAGAFRKGKSFLLNFFLRYLDAQYKKHDVTDWIGERTNGAGMAGFAFAGGRKPKTTGIWMWSEIFTHDYENGEKVAIILLDTQGIFDSSSNLMDNTTIFAISMMLSSVQCYNVMQNIQEDDLQHLELFTEYGRLALNQTSEKAFQKLLFIVRDWPNAFEMPYGDGQAFVNELMAETDGQTNDMKQLRKLIKSSFDKLAAYLMPFPGIAVAAGRNTNADLSQIDPEFVDHLKILVPLIFAPENLIPKKISGEKIRVRDLVTYLQTYVNIFSGGTLPEPKTVLDATASTLLLILCTDCFNAYSEAMKNNLDEISRNANQPYYTPVELSLLHDKTKSDSLSQFHQRQKIGNQALISEAETKLTKKIDEKYSFFFQKNDQKKIAFMAKAMADLHDLEVACLETYDDELQSSLDPTYPLSSTDLRQIHDTAKEESLSKFNNERKLGGSELIESSRNKLEYEIDLQFAKYERQNDTTRQAIEDMRRRLKEEEERALAKLREEELQRQIEERERQAKRLELVDECVETFRDDYQNRVFSRKHEEYGYYYVNPSLMQDLYTEASNSAYSLYQRDCDDYGGCDNASMSRLGRKMNEIRNEIEDQNNYIFRQVTAVRDREYYRRQFEYTQNQLRYEQALRSCSIL